MAIDGSSARLDPQSMRPFFAVWTGQTASLLGSQLVQFALVWWLTSETGSANVLAMAALVAILPQVAIGPFAGALVKGILLGVWGRLRQRVVTQMAALVLDGTVIVGLALTPAGVFGVAVVLVAAGGLLEAIAVGLSGAIAQAIIRPEIQGRVFALSMSVTQALAPLGLLVAGPTADALGVRFWWLLTGVVIAARAAQPCWCRPS